MQPCYHIERGCDITAQLDITSSGGVPRSATRSMCDITVNHPSSDLNHGHKYPANKEPLIYSYPQCNGNLEKQVLRSILKHIHARWRGSFEWGWHPAPVSPSRKVHLDRLHWPILHASLKSWTGTRTWPEIKGYRIWGTSMTFCRNLIMRPSFPAHSRSPPVTPTLLTSLVG